MGGVCARAVESPDVSDILVLTDNAIRILEARYLARGPDGVKETPEGLFRRVARHVAEAEDDGVKDKWASIFYQLMASGRFLPNSPTLMNSGRPFGMLSACFVLPVPDDTAGIFQSVADTAIIQKAGGGTGFAFDELRPCGAFIASSGGQSSGPLPFWRVFSEATCAIQQGSFRRGANMAVMSVEHPDIIKFLYAKQDPQQFTDYNISVKITDVFMDQVRQSPDALMVVRWKDSAWLVPRSILDRCHAAVEAGRNGLDQARKLDVCYGIQDLVQLTGADVVKKSNMLTVGEVMDLIVKHAWQTGEPGLFFIDRVRETEPTAEVAKIQACNPCAEEPLMPHEACNLGSINLGRFVDPFYDLDQLSMSGDGVLDRQTAESLVDWDGLRQAVHSAVRFLDNVVSVNQYPTSEIAHTCRHNRKIGLGVMGFADALLKMGVKYDSDEGLYWGGRFMGLINEEAIRASCKLAKDREPFPWFGYNSRWEVPMRNACVTTVAPTGTISILADCSGGIEPWFSFAFVRQILDDGRGNKQRMIQYQKDLRALSDKFKFGSKELTEHILATGTLQDRDDVPSFVKHIFRSARDISPDWHVKMQSIFQRHVTSAVSKTINLPAEATVEDVRSAYMGAYLGRCKGVTVYRDGCRKGQPMALSNTADRDCLPAAAGVRVSFGSFDGGPSEVLRKPHDDNGGSACSTGPASGRIKCCSIRPDVHQQQPCPSEGCPGELVYTEGCCKCLICGRGAC